MPENEKKLGQWMGEDHHCLVIDWRMGVEELFRDAKSHCPDLNFESEIEPFENGETFVKITCGETQVQQTLPKAPAHHAAVLLHQAISPEYEIRAFQSSRGDDTSCCLIRPGKWWKALKRKIKAKRFKEIFYEVEKFLPPDLGLFYMVTVNRDCEEGKAVNDVIMEETRQYKASVWNTKPGDVGNSDDYGSFEKLCAAEFFIVDFTDGFSHSEYNMICSGHDSADEISETLLFLAKKGTKPPKFDIYPYRITFYTDLEELRAIVREWLNNKLQSTQ